MHATRTAHTIASHWQQAVDAGLEAGVRPILHGRGHAQLLPSAAMLAALQLLRENRQDAAQPMVVVGGASALWVVALFAPRPFHGSAYAVPPEAAYAGDDPATGMACLATWVDGVTPSPYIANRTCFHLFDAEFLPDRHPGDVVRWEQLPFLSAPFAPTTAMSAGGQGADEASTGVVHEIARAAPGNQTRDPSRDWLGWAILVLVVLMPLLAMAV